MGKCVCNLFFIRSSKSDMRWVLLLKCRTSHNVGKQISKRLYQVADQRQRDIGTYAELYFPLNFTVQNQNKQKLNFVPTYRVAIEENFATKQGSSSSKFKKHLTGPSITILWDF